MISCLTVTRAERWPLLRQAIADFARQTHAESELVIVYTGDIYNGSGGFATALRDEIARYGDAIGARVRCLQEPADLPLGALRNRALAHARGEFVCQWDDDDRCHPQRL